MSHGDRWEELTGKHREEKAQLIAHAALSLLLSDGASALTMSRVASAAGVSRQTLYRYYPDVDAVLVGIVTLLAAHDDSFEQLVLAQPTPTAQFDTLATAVATSGHGDLSPASLAALLPSSARDALATHELRTTKLLSDVLARGVTSGEFRSDIRPDDDAPLLVALLAASYDTNAQRSIELAWRLIAPTPEQKDPS